MSSTNERQARARGAEPTLEHAAETVMWIVEQGGASGIFHAIDEADLDGR